MSYVSDGKFGIPYHQTFYDNITKQANFIEFRINLELTTNLHTTKDPVLPMAASIFGPIKVIKVTFMGDYKFL